MKAIPVPTRARMLNELLKKARHKQIVLESSDGERFVLTSLQNWEGYEVDEDDNIIKNKKLMRHLASRRSGGKKIPLAQVKAELGL